jgi:tRNA U34 5-methylaminomethyl-2-thiouridine-forming methyltransferase MnmC
VERKIVVTKDSSPSIFVPELDETYHSIHGALQESKHVFIEAGLAHLNYLSQINLLEIGFGTGLNALLSAQMATTQKFKINYTGLEKYPVKPQEWAALNYAHPLHTAKTNALFEQLHQSLWEEPQALNPHFTLTKKQVDFRTATLPANHFHLIYFDAFAPSAQAYLWTLEMFERMYNCLQEDGILVTYCVKGSVRRNMKAAGFEVEKIPGPPGKREMARAQKPITPKL